MADWRKDNEKKPILFRDGVLLLISGGGSGFWRYMAGQSSGSMITAYTAWSNILGFIALVILFTLVTEALKKSSKNKRD